ncbi:hypothetical protein ACLOAU_06835 [Niabella sp. CJ426]|uniref:hypothetical protein n=1 Tax=Niabella sp. CJ426 TaxID=3393740 RepID=UPI003CFE8EE3
MKKILPIILVSLVLFACSKEDSQKQPPPPVIDYSLYKIKTATHSVRNYNGTSSNLSFDTTNYLYEGNTYRYTRRTSMGTVQSYTHTLSNGIYTSEQYNNGTLSNSKTYDQLNTAGYVDSSWILNNGTVTQSSKYNYNKDGTLSDAASYFSGYINKAKYYYTNNTATYYISERRGISPGIPNALDSVVYEYAANLPYRAGFYSGGLPVSFYGKFSKNLLQKTTYYDKLNNKVIRQTVEYQYQTDDIGLVTKRVLNIYTQPGSTLIQTDTTVYTYYNK